MSAFGPYPPYCPLWLQMIKVVFFLGSLAFLVWIISLST